MKRYLEEYIIDDLSEKIILMSGPRQSGKTTLAKSLFPGKTEYLNYDYISDRMILLKNEWKREGKELVVFDELHKMRKWKQWVKGIYDKEGTLPRLLVTGSARMELSRKSGDSLAGRYFHYRLNPLSIGEVKSFLNPDVALDRFLKTGPFPEPFLKDSDKFYKRWRRTHIDTILREDLPDLERVSDIKSIEVLVELLSERVGSPVSLNALSIQLQVSPHTIKRWVNVLERLYVIFTVTPFSRNIARAILKEPKIYFYDTARVKNGEGAMIENFVAYSLFKRNQFLQDTSGEEYALHYIRDHQKREVDFLVLKNRKPEYLLEVKSAQESPAGPLLHYSPQIKPIETLQLVARLHKEKDIPIYQSGKHDGKSFLKIRSLASWLANLEV